MPFSVLLAGVPQQASQNLQLQIACPGGIHKLELDEGDAIVSKEMLDASVFLPIEKVYIKGRLQINYLRSR